MVAESAGSAGSAGSGDYAASAAFVTPVTVTAVAVTSGAFVTLAASAASPAPAAQIRHRLGSPPRQTSLALRRLALVRDPIAPRREGMQRVHMGPDLGRQHLNRGPHRRKELPHLGRTRLVRRVQLD
jgi:hypothetical protein